MARDRMELDRGGGSSEEGVAAEMRIDPGVRGNAVEGGVELGGGEDVISAASDGTRLRERDTQVGREIVIDVAEHAGGDHRFGAAAAFFGGLEDQFNFTATIL